MNNQTLLGAIRSKCSQTGEYLLFLANSMIANEFDILQISNTMIRLSPTTDNTPQVCISIRDIFIVNVPPILDPFREAKPRTSHVTSFCKMLLDTELCWGKEPEYSTHDLTHVITSLVTKTCVDFLLKACGRRNPTQKSGVGRRALRTPPSPKL